MRKASRRHHAFQISTGAFGAWIGLQQLPEAGSVSWHEKMCEFVEKYVVDDVLGHALEAVGKPDGAFGGSAGAPAGILVGHPSDGVGAGPAAKVLGGQLPGAGGQFLVAENSAAFLC